MSRQSSMASGSRGLARFATIFRREQFLQRHRECPTVRAMVDVATPPPNVGGKRITLAARDEIVVHDKIHPGPEQRHHRFLDFLRTGAVGKLEANHAYFLISAARAERVEQLGIPP